MATKPTTKPRWASAVAYPDPPLEGKKDIGFIGGERPPAQWLNWLLRKIYDWITYLDEFEQDNRNFSGLVEFSGPVRFSALDSYVQFTSRTVSSIGNLLAAVNGSTTILQTSHMWVTSSGAYSIMDIGQPLTGSSVSSVDVWMRGDGNADATVSLRRFNQTGEHVMVSQVFNNVSATRTKLTITNTDTAPFQDGEVISARVSAANGNIEHGFYKMTFSR
jgi:hypothetical protein